MAGLLGEFEAKLDNKGRFALPAGLRRQLSPDANERFVLNRGFEKCLTLYPWNVWESITQELDALNPYVKENREFIRFFHRGAQEIQLDAAGRILIPKRLLEYAGIGLDIVLSAHTNKIEIWAGDEYDSILNDMPGDFAALAERVMGGKGGQLNG